MKTFERLSMEERTLLVQLEEYAVRQRGRFLPAHISPPHQPILARWVQEGFVSVGHIPPACHQPRAVPLATHCVELSEAAWKLAAVCRMQAGLQGIAKRGWFPLKVPETANTRNGSVCIHQCPDPLMWYADKVGSCVQLDRDPNSDPEYFWARDNGGFINIIRKTDATLVP